MGRAVLNISVPETIKKDIVRRSKKAKTTVSGYILRVIKLEQSMISENELLARVRESRKNYKTGKTKILRSLEDLM